MTSSHSGEVDRFTYLLSISFVLHIIVKEHPSGIVPTIQNVVATSSLGTHLDLRTVASNVRNIEYNPKRFPAAVFRLREPKATLLIFESGKIVCTGAKSEEQARLASRKTAKIISKIRLFTIFSASLTFVTASHSQLHIRFQTFHIENIVGLASHFISFQYTTLSELWCRLSYSVGCSFYHPQPILFCLF